MNRFVIAGLLLIVLLIESGCASIMGKSVSRVMIDSDPNGAIVTIKDKRGYVVEKGETPFFVNLSSSAGYFQRAKYQIILEKDGYDQSVENISADLSRYYWGGILFPVGLIIVDPLTGAMWQINDNYVYKELSPESGR